MEIASMGVEEDRLSKVFIAGLRTEPDQTDRETSLEVEQSTMGTAMASLASLSLDMGNPTHTVHSITQNRQVLSWERLETHSAQDRAIAALVDMVNKGSPDNRESWPDNTKEFFRVRSELSTIGPVALYGERVIIPSSLRAEALEVLHSAHQGTTGMTARATNSVYWPGMLSDIAKKREACTSCDRSTPSQPAAPPTPLLHPSYPFELVCSDYMTLHGRKFLIIIDNQYFSLAALQRICRNAVFLHENIQLIARNAAKPTTGYTESL